MKKYPVRCPVTAYLREMEEDKLISRRANNKTLPRVVYELTDYDRTLLPGLAMLREWGLQFLKENKDVIHCNKTKTAIIRPEPVSRF